MIGSNQVPGVPPSPVTQLQGRLILVTDWCGTVIHTSRDLDNRLAGLQPTTH